jgi:hypothetical protein
MEENCMTRVSKILILTLALVLCFALTAVADPIAASLTGTRSTSVGGVTTNAGSNWDGTGDNGFEISWKITYNSGIYTYTYDISGVGGADLSQNLSHWICEVTNPSELSDFTSNPAIDDGPKTFTSGGSNPDMPASGIYGIKWNATTATYTVTFTTTKDPVWGDFYAKDGVAGTSGIWNVAYNTGFGTDPTSSTTNFTPWIATPDGGVVTPIPGSLLLLGSGLLGLVGLRRKF